MLFVPDENREWWDAWGFEGPRHPCFLCANPVGEGPVVTWMGAAGSRGADPPPGPLLEVIKAMESRGGVTAAANIFFHPVCIPSFCRRILMDWEAVERPHATAGDYRQGG